MPRLNHPSQLAAAEAVNGPLDTTDPASRRPKAVRFSTAHVSRLARAATGLTQTEYGEACGDIRPVPQQVVSAWERSDTQFRPHVDHLARGPREARRVWVRELAAMDGDAVVPAAIVQHGDNHVTRLARVASECADVTAETGRALADGVFCKRDAERVLVQVREAQAALAEKEAYLLALLKQ